MRPTSGLTTCVVFPTNSTSRWPSANRGESTTSIVRSSMVPPRNSSCVTGLAAPFHTSSTRKVTMVMMARPREVDSMTARWPTTWPTKIVRASATSSSKVGGMTVVERATPPETSRAKSVSGMRYRRIVPPLG